MSKIFISHPGLQHSHQLAWALHQRGLLQSFWSGVPVVSGDGEPPFWLPASSRQRLKIIPVTSSLCKHFPFFPAMLRTSKWLPSGFSRADYACRLDQSFDWWVAKHVVRLKPEVVVAYENAAYYTFRAAKAIGARCILDAASVHHLVGSQLSEVKQSPHLAETNRRLDSEIDQADLILTCSPFAAQSYINSGIPSDKVHSILLGASPSSCVTRNYEHDRPLHFLFAGGLRRLKAIDLILATFNRLHSEGINYQLTFVGGAVEPDLLELIKNTPSAKYLPSMPQNSLFRLMSHADCLLLPSRFDSFGMVVPEAMACGTPCIVSTQTGAKAIIEMFPEAGWIVEPNVEELYTCIKARIFDRSSLFLAREPALFAASHFTWEAYRSRAGDYIENWVSRI